MKVLVVVGTRPEAIKMAPVIHALRQRPEHFETEVCLTAQHRELLDQVVSAFDLPVHYDLDLMTHAQTLEAVSAAILQQLPAILALARPDLVLVHGDTTTSFAAALAAFYAQIPVGHVEAGLRTYQRYAPFPEEANRRLCDVLCTWHYAPTEGARANLLAEHIDDRSILVTGNTAVDALLFAAELPHPVEDPLLRQLGTERRLLLVTAHRRESFGEPLAQMCRAIRDIVAHNPDLEVLYPVHPNPQVRAAVDGILQGQERIHCVAPLEYVPFVQMMRRAHLILTDSGGIQEEAPSLRKPVLVMREVTERPEAVAAGGVQLVGSAYDAIVGGIQRLLDDADCYRRMSTGNNPFGDGQAAQRIAQHLAQL